MKQQIKFLAKRILPPNAYQHLRRFVKSAPSARDRREVERIFADASDAPPYLDPGALEILQDRYPFPPDYGWDSEAVDRRGRERSSDLLRLPGAQAATSYLELGCWDGMVSCHLARAGKQTTAIDFRDIGFDERASRGGVRLMQMNAAQMQFENNSFDFVFSYDSFEHFASPEDVLIDALRVVRKGGYIYLDFAPLYYSPFGEHATDSITVPYCQFLFPKPLLNEFAGKKGLKLIDFSHVNGWSLEDYRGLWSRHASTLKRVRYFEGLALSHLDLIKAYPSCFTSKSRFFENFVVDQVEILFQKIAE